ncbi:MAG: glycosyltransferase family 4 protein, partial [Candidatus Omnitrophota bacterium]
GLDIFTSDRSLYAISKHPLVQEADIIHLHWIATMVNYTEFFRNMENKPAVWTLHDMNPFTGGCHYAVDCTKYEIGCNSCPQLSSKDPNDLSRRIFKRKEKAYKGRNIHIVTPSKWLAGCAKRSLLFKNFKIDVISHGVSTSVFTKRDKQYSRNLLNLPTNKTLILFGADYKAERKGFKYLMEALKLLKERIDTSNIALVTFGPKQDIRYFSKNTGFTVYQLGRIDNEALLSALYSSCDMFIIPSLEEAFGQTCLESMACGTPAIGFNTGGIPDMIIPHKTGLLVELKNIKDLTDKIEYMLTYPKERQEMGENARKLVEQECTLQIQAKRYLKLYEKMLSASAI